MNKKFLTIIALSAMMGSMGSMDKAVAGFSSEDKKINCIEPDMEKSPDASKCATACTKHCGKNPSESHYKETLCKFKKPKTCGCSCEEKK